MKNFFKNLIFSKSNYKFFINNYTKLDDLKTISFASKSLRSTRSIKHIILDKPLKGNTLIFAPHPDDEIIGLGGTMINSIKNKSSIHCIYFSSNKERSEESKKISKLLGFTTTNLKLKENNFIINKENLIKISKIINEIKPQKIFLPFLFDDHDDHRRVNQILMEIEKNKLSKINYEVWGYQVYSFFPTNVYVDITKNINKKVFYLKKYKSQIKKKNFDHFTIGINAYNSRFINTKKISYGETFFVCPKKDYLDLCQHYFKNPKKCFYNKNYI